MQEKTLWKIYHHKHQDCFSVYLTCYSCILKEIPRYFTDLWMWLTWRWNFKYFCVTIKSYFRFAVYCFVNFKYFTFISGMFFYPWLQSNVFFVNSISDLLIFIIHIWPSIKDTYLLIFLGGKVSMSVLASYSLSILLQVKLILVSTLLH